VGNLLVLKVLKPLGVAVFFLCRVSLCGPARPRLIFSIFLALVALVTKQLSRTVLFCLKGSVLFSMLQGVVLALASASA